MHVREASIQVKLDKDFGSIRGKGLGNEFPGSDPLKE
jgi:hypothetical protein